MVKGLYLQHTREKFEIPKKIYAHDKDFIKRVIRSFQSTNRNMGVLLTGLKGAGKTITAKIIANELNLPVILISHNYEGIPEFINDINFECVVFIDEYEKVFVRDERGKLLSCMDGTQTSTQKSLYLLTTNNLYVNENLLNRPSRVRYVKKYEDLNKGQVAEIVNDLLSIKENTEDTIEVISNLDSITIDLVIELIKEANLHEEPVSKFINVFNCNQDEKNENNYKIIDKQTGRVYYESVVLKETLAPYTERNKWLQDKDYCQILQFLEPTGENSCKVKLYNPDYAIYEALHENDDENNKNAPPMFIDADIYYERAKKKHWAYSGY
jgi:SpoVK/Ycf46/Vps4 family AAA+-type ATPase